MSGERPNGVALLLVLAMLVVASAGAVAVVRVGTGDRLGRGLARDGLMAEELLGAGERAAVAWLDERAERVVLGAEVEVPAVLVLDDRLELAGRDARITIAAWDQAGMVSAGMLDQHPEV